MKRRHRIARFTHPRARFSDLKRRHDAARLRKAGGTTFIATVLAAVYGDPPSDAAAPFGAFTVACGRLAHRRQHLDHVLVTAAVGRGFLLPAVDAATYSVTPVGVALITDRNACDHSLGKKSPALADDRTFGDPFDDAAAPVLSHAKRSSLRLAARRVRKVGGAAFLSQVFASVFALESTEHVAPVGHFIRHCRISHNRPYLGRAAVLHGIRCGYLEPVADTGYSLTPTGRELVGDYVEAMFATDAPTITPAEWVTAPA